MLRMPLTVLGDPQPLPSQPQEGPNAPPPNPVYIPPSNSTISTPNTVAPIVQYPTSSTLPAFNPSIDTGDTAINNADINNKRLMIIGGISLIALYLIVSNKK